ncbi:MAG: OmpH family outer membrane protein [Holosporaceae bacterium]|nr:OmpH family outer membrane protein [Holosporaceae bacterium]
MRLVLVTLGILLFESSYASSAPKCANSASVFVILDLKKVASESVAGKNIESQIEAINKESQKDLLDLESKIKSMESSRKSDYDARKIEELQIMLYDMVRTIKRRIAKAYEDAIAALDQEMRKVISKIAAEKGIEVVINAEAVVYVKNGHDITEEVINKLNETCKSIKVEIKNS